MGSPAPLSELKLPWSLAVAACVVAATMTASKTTLSLAIGGLLLAAGSLLALSALLALGDRSRLVSKGLYGWVRHPFYLGLLVMLVGAVIVTRSLIGALLFIPALTLTLARARREEHNLRLQFGASHQASPARVPFIFPYPRPAPTRLSRDRGQQHQQRN